jgi:glycosyltransferase involved in cell wall biosynthesis
LPWILGRMPVGFRPIVVDNCSTDGSGEVAKSLGATVVPEPTRGFGAAAHAGRRTGLGIRDLGPMRAAGREALLSLNLADRRFGYPLEMVMNAAAAGWRVSEVEVTYLPRIGKSKVTGTVGGCVRTVRDMSQVLAR